MYIGSSGYTSALAWFNIPYQPLLNYLKSSDWSEHTTTNFRYVQCHFNPYCDRFFLYFVFSRMASRPKRRRTNPSSPPNTQWTLSQLRALLHLMWVQFFNPAWRRLCQRLKTRSKSVWKTIFKTIIFYCLSNPQPCSSSTSSIPHTGAYREYSARHLRYK